MYNYIDYGLSTSMRHRQAPFKDWLPPQKYNLLACYQSQLAIVAELIFSGGQGLS